MAKSKNTGGNKNNLNSLKATEEAIKRDRELTQQARERIKLYKEEQKQLKEKNSLIEDLEKLGSNIDATQKKRLDDLKEEKKQLEEILKLKEDQNKIDEEIEENEKTRELRIKRLKKAQREQLDLVTDQLSGTEEIDSALQSIAVNLGKNNKIYTNNLEASQKFKVVQGSISKILQKAAEDGASITEKDQLGIARVVSAREENLASIAKIQQMEAEGSISRDEALKQIQQENDAFISIASSLQLSQEAMERIGPIINSMVREAKSFSDVSKKSLGSIEAMDRVFDTFSGIPVMSELSKLLKTNIRDTLAWKAAVFALGAALGKAAYDYFGAPIKAALQADKERKQNEIDTTAAIAKLRKDAEFIPAQIAQERREQEIENANDVARIIHDAAYAGVRAAHEFQVNMKQGAAQFERAAKTALFGKKIGSVGYGAAQLQLAGISAEKIADAMNAAASATGKMPSGEIGADMALMAERTGQSVDDIASINEFMQRTEGVSEKVALNLQEGMRAMADKAGVSLGKLMREIAEASKDALSYNIKSGKALAKQVAYANSIGVNFGDIAKAGKSMVLNYKDSIKAEMQLSTLLGEQVDLSEVRALAAEGKYDDAMKALQAQGLDPSTMDIFQQEALSQALGGLDLTSISKIAQNTGAQVGALEGASAKAGGQEFLKTTEKAEQALSAKQASISAESAIFDAKLSGKIAEAYLASPEYTKYKQAQNAASQEAEKLSSKMKDAWLETDDYKKSLADTLKLNFVDNIKENLFGGLAMIGGGLATSLVDRLIPKKDTKQANKGFFSRIGGLFSFGKNKIKGPEGTTPSGPAPSGPAPTTTSSTMVTTPSTITTGTIDVSQITNATTNVGNSLQTLTGGLNLLPAPLQNATNGLRLLPQSVQDVTGNLKLLPASVQDVASGFRLLPASIQDATGGLKLLPPSVQNIIDDISESPLKLNDSIEDIEFEDITPMKSISLEGSIPLPLPVTIVGGLENMEETKTKTSSDKKKNVFGKIGDWFKKKWEGVTGFFSSIAERISNAWQGVTDWFRGIGDRIGNMWKGITDWFKGIFTKVGEKIGSVWQRITGFFSGIGDAIKEKWEKVTGFFSGIGDRIRNLWTQATGFIQNAISTGWERVVNFFSGIVDTVKTFFKTKVAGMFKKGGLKSMAPGGGDEGGGGGEEMGMSSITKGGSKLGQNLAGFGKGAGQLLANLGKGAGELIKGILTGIAQGLMQFANPAVLAGAAGLAASIALIGAGIAGAAWIMGKALPTLAEGMKSFNDVDGANLARVGLGIGALGVGLSAMGVGAVIGGIGNLVGSLFGGGIEETIKKVEAFGKADINPDKVKANADAIVAYSKAMAMSGLGSAASGIGNMVGAIADGIAGFFGKKPPIEQMQDFAKYDFGKDAEKIKQNAEVFAIFGNAMSSFRGGSGSLGGVLGDALAGFFKVKPPVEQMLEFAKYDFGPQKEKIKANAETFSIFAKAISEFKGGSGSIGGVIGDALAGFFKTKPPIEQLQDFAKLPLLPKETIKSNAEAFTAFAKAMATYEGGSGSIGGVLADALSGFFDIEPPIDKFVNFANLPKFDLEKVKNNADAFVAFGNAMASYGGTSEGFFSSLGKGLAAFFGGGEKDLIGDFERFAKVDASGMESVSAAVATMSERMRTFDSASVEAAGVGIYKFVDQLNDGEIAILSALSAPLSNVASALGTLSNIKSNSEIVTLGSNISTFATNINSVSGIYGIIANIAQYINTLTNSLNNLANVNSGLISLLGINMATFAAAIGNLNVTVITTAGMVLANFGQTLSTAFSPQVTDSLSRLNAEFQKGFVNYLQLINAQAPTYPITAAGLLQLSSAFVQMSLVNYQSIQNLGKTFADYFGSDFVSNMGNAINTLNSGFIEGMNQLTSIGPQINETATAISNLAIAIKQLSKIDGKIINDIPWGKLQSFASSGGKIQVVQSANKSFNVTADTAKNIETIKNNDKINAEKIAKDSSEMVRLTKNLQTLITVLAQGNQLKSNPIQLQIDGKPVMSMIQKRIDGSFTGTPNNGSTFTNPSDIRLKHNIQLVGKSTSGINIYTFEYVEKVGMTGLYEGVMAQELIGTEYESALIFDGKYYSVDYNKLDVDFIRIY